MQSHNSIDPVFVFDADINSSAAYSEYTVSTYTYNFKFNKWRKNT